MTSKVDNVVADERLDESFFMVPFSQSTENVLITSDTEPSWISNVVTCISEWMSSPSFYQNNITTPETSLWDDWQWVLSATEEFLATQAQENNNKLESELSCIRSSARQMAIRPFFLENAKAAFQLLTDGEAMLLRNSILDSSKRSKIISDVVQQLAPEWLQYLEKNILNSATEFRESYYEGTYAKNVTGAMKEYAWNASHGPGHIGLNYAVLADIMWSLWQSLVKGLQEITKVQLSFPQQKGLCDMICHDAQRLLLTLWIETVKNSKLGTERAGIVVKRIQDAEEAHRAHLQMLKKNGVDAKYNSVVQSTIIQPHEHGTRIKDLRDFLSSNLEFRRPYVVQSA